MTSEPRIVWRVPDCAWCKNGIDAEDPTFVQLFGDEGDYYFHAVCYSAYKNGESRPTPKGALPDEEGDVV
jgi:hypothetical protein